MDSIFNRKWFRVLLGSLIAIIGIVILIIAITNPSDISKWFSIIVAVVLFVLAAIAIAVGVISVKQPYFKSTLVVGSLAITIGVVLLCNQGIVGTIATLFISIMAIALGGILLINTTSYYIVNKTNRNLVLTIILFALSLILIAAGIVMLIFQKDIETIMFIVAAVIIILVGICEVILALANKKGPIDTTSSNAKNDGKTTAITVKAKKTKE